MSSGNRHERIAAILIASASAAFVLAYLGVALARIRYPYELEWMEGGMVDHVRCVLAGQPIYAQPSIEFVSFLYPPLYYEAAAIASRLVGTGFFPLRLLSLFSSLAVFALLFALVRRETGSAFAGVAAAGLYAATYDRVDGWFDLARLDSFYVMILLSAVFVLRGARSAVGSAGAGILLGAAFFTKQSALVIAVPLVLAAALADVRRAAWFAGAAGLVIGGGTFLMDRATSGWFRYYCFFLPGRHPRIPGGWLSFWTADLLPALPLASVLAAAYGAMRLRGDGGRERFFFPLAAAGMVGSSWLVRNMVGAEVNNLLPALAATCVLAALCLHELQERASATPDRFRRIAAIAATLALAVQLLLLAYDPRRHLPTAADRAAGDGLVSKLAAIPGEIYVPHHGYLARLAGKRSYAHTLAMDNVYLDDDGPLRERLGGEVVLALSERRFAAVLLESDGRYGEAILASYEPREPLFARPDVFWPVSGGKLRPEALCLPKAGVSSRP